MPYENTAKAFSMFEYPSWLIAGNGAGDEFDRSLFARTGGRRSRVELGLGVVTGGHPYH